MSIVRENMTLQEALDMERACWNRLKVLTLQNGHKIARLQKEIEDQRDTWSAYYGKVKALRRAEEIAFPDGGQRASCPVGGNTPPPDGVHLDFDGAGPEPGHGVSVCKIGCNQSGGINPPVNFDKANECLSNNLAEEWPKSCPHCFASWEKGDDICYHCREFYNAELAGPTKEVQPNV